MKTVLAPGSAWPDFKFIPQPRAKTDRKDTGNRSKQRRLGIKVHRVIEYIVTHPRCTAPQIAASIKIPLKRVLSTLWQYVQLDVIVGEVRTQTNDRGFPLREYTMKE